MNIDPAEMAKNAAQAEAFLEQLANRNRLMVLCLLAQGEMSVGELNERLPVSQSVLSQHLAKLRQAGFVSTRRESQTIFYQLTDPQVKAVIANLYQQFCG